MGQTKLSDQPIPQVDVGETIALLASLVAIDSQNPDLVPGAPGEGAIAAFIAQLAADAGLEVEMVEPEPGRPSVVATLRGAGSGRTLLLNAHTDTVALGEAEDPLTPTYREGRMYARGAYDMKGGLAALLVAALTIARSGVRLAGDLIITAVSDEEYASIGTASVIDHLRRAGRRVDAAIVAEPTELGLCVAHKGFAWARIETRGRAAHGSRRDEGIDAIFHMARVLTRLEALDAALQTRPPHPILGHGSLHASLVSGGSGLSTYPDSCVLEIERRTLPNEDERGVAAELEAILAAERAADPTFDARAEITLYRAPFEIGQDQPIVQMLAAAANPYDDMPPRFYGATFWMDSALLSAAGIPTVIYGPYGEGAHAKVEWVDLASVAYCAQVYTETALTFCGTAD